MSTGHGNSYELLAEEATMTTTPGLRTEAGKRLLEQEGLLPLFLNDGNGILRDYILAIEAEARADVDGLVARLVEAADNTLSLRADFIRDGSLDFYSATAQLRRVTEEARRFLAGDKAEAPLSVDEETAQWVAIGKAMAEAGKRATKLSAGDKAEAPEDDPMKNSDAGIWEDGE